MAFQKICTLEDIWEGEMKVFKTEDGINVLVVAHPDDKIVIFQSMCPHQEIKLSKKGALSEDGVLTCTAHLWQFDSCTGEGLNPKDCKLAVYPSKVENGDIYVDTVGIVPEKSHS
jgi:toluene monooxygenase system ferredoxin subunit